MAAWLGQGTVYLLVRTRWANLLMILLGLASLYGWHACSVPRCEPDYDDQRSAYGKRIERARHRHPWRSAFDPFFNIYGTLTLVGGAAYSAWIFWRKRILLHRAIGNVFIAVGALLPAFGGTFSRFGGLTARCTSANSWERLMFIGFIRVITPMEQGNR